MPPGYSPLQPLPETSVTQLLVRRPGYTLSRDYYTSDALFETEVEHFGEFYLKAIAAE